MINNKPIQLVLFISSLVAIAAINYTILHSPFVFLMIFLLLIHELGHYYAAKRNNIAVMFPFFIPIPLLLVGVTMTKNSDEKARKYISISGALATSLTIVILLLFNFYYKVISIYFLLSLLFGEIFFNYVGVDGQRYRGTLFNKKKTYLNQHIETEFSKEPLWNLIADSPYRKKSLRAAYSKN
jgi:Zn-dependent protease